MEKRGEFGTKIKGKKHRDSNLKNNRGRKAMEARTVLENITSRIRGFLFEY